MVHNGFTLAESPLWDHCGQQLLFTDVQGGAGENGVIHTLSASDELGVLMSDTTNANGIALDIDGSLILAQMGGGGHLSRRRTDGTVEPLEPAGSPNLHTPDDVIVRSDGTIYFSDGDFYPIGSLLGYASRLPVYVLKPGATALVNAGSISGPNGLELSADERTLFASAYGADTIMKFSVADDGSLTAAGMLINGLNMTDSLCLDAAGNVYIGMQTGLQVVAPDGTKIKHIPIPGYTATTGTTSCTFGGADGTTLYITSWTTLYRITGMPIPGQDWLTNRERSGCH
jgi:gluconolactonase